MTQRLFLDDTALRQARATVLAAGPDGIVLDRTVFYARAGGQPGDTGTLQWEGQETPVTEAVKGAGDDILHLPVAGAPLPAVGAAVEAVLDWPRRHALMRMHTALHLLCSLLPGAAVTGGQIGAERSRLDFDLPGPPPIEALADGFRALIGKRGKTPGTQVQHWRWSGTKGANLRQFPTSHPGLIPFRSKSARGFAPVTLIAANHPVSSEWVDESVLDSNPGLVRTLSVQPPRGTGRLRLVRIGGDPLIDLQPCGGTHVASTAEIGGVRVLKIENKGRQNRRIAIALETEA